MSEDEHSDSEFYYPDELHESHEENSKDTALSGYEQVYENGQEEIESSVNKQKSENTTRNTYSDMKTFQRYLSSVNKGNEEVLDLTAGDLDHFGKVFQKCLQNYIMATSLNLTCSKIFRFLGFTPFAGKSNIQRGTVNTRGRRA